MTVLNRSQIQKDYPQYIVYPIALRRHTSGTVCSCGRARGNAYVGYEWSLTTTEPRISPDIYAIGLPIAPRPGTSVL